MAGGAHKRAIKLVGDPKYHKLTVRLDQTGKEKGLVQRTRPFTFIGSGGWI